VYSANRAVSSQANVRTAASDLFTMNATTERHQEDVAITYTVIRRLTASTRPV